MIFFRMYPFYKGIFGMMSCVGTQNVLVEMVNMILRRESRKFGSSVKRCAKNRKYHTFNQQAEGDPLYTVDLRSDTLTKPSAKMRQAMAEAVVGDDVMGEDPTVNALQNRVADMFGKEAALFVPTGTMGNLISVLSHCNERGLEVLLGDKCHISLYEQGGISQLGGVHPRSLVNKSDGTFDLGSIDNLIRPKNDAHQPWTRVVCIENTHNYCGGKVIPQDFLQKLRKKADEHELIVHMDGARFMNAAVAMDKHPSELLQYVDSISLCFSKGLGAPVGSIIAGENNFISRCHRLRKVLGGGMRQAGVLAAAAMVALDEAVPTLQRDHHHAQMLGQALKMEAGTAINIDVEGIHSNIIMLHMQSADLSAIQLFQRLQVVTDEEYAQLKEKISVLTIPVSKTMLRLVTHCNVSEEAINLAIRKFKYVLCELNQHR